MGLREDGGLIQVDLSEGRSGRCRAQTSGVGTVIFPRLFWIQVAKVE